jgi:hypothetical protein
MLVSMTASETGSESAADFIVLPVVLGRTGCVPVVEQLVATTTTASRISSLYVHPQ